MQELSDESVNLIVTSPPYPMIEMWDDLFRKIDERINQLWLNFERETNPKIKNNLIQQIFELMHKNLAQVWKECYRVLLSDGYLCINIGDATRSIANFFRLFPNHSKIIEYCESIGFNLIGQIFWKKPTNKPNAFLGSGFLPPNAYVTLDCELILIFKKGEPKENEFISQIWEIPGTKQTVEERRVGAFPEKVPAQLIKMFSEPGDTVLDPFLGTGTTTKVAISLNRNSIGYEINESLIPIIKKKLNLSQSLLIPSYEVKLIKRKP